MNISAKLLASAFCLIAPVTGTVSGSAMAQEEADEAETAYIFSSFRGDGETGLHLAYSYDGLTWTALRDDASYMEPKVGNNLMRDPHIRKGSDGKFHMVWTTGWWENNLGVAHSDDLMNWSEQQEVPVMAHEPEVMNTWAPEIEWDAEEEEYIIFWSSSIPGKFPETEDRGDIRSTLGVGMSQRIYYTTTEDFETYAPTEVFYDGGFVSIDASIIQDGERYVMFIKDETKRPEPEKNIRIAIAADMQGPWGPSSPPFSPEGIWVEGPAPVKIGDWFYVYYDAYMEHRMMAARSKDLIHWEDISDEISFPEGSRHGSVIEVDASVVEALIAAQ